MADPTKRAPEDQVPLCAEASKNKRRSWANHRELVRATNRARARAVKLLIRNHPDEFERLHAQCGEEQGVTTKPLKPAMRGGLAGEAEAVLGEQEPEHANGWDEQMWLQHRLDELTTLLHKVQEES